MKVEKVLKKLNIIKVNGEIAEIDIREISSDSRKISKGDCFVAISGQLWDGHNFITEAIKKGASLIIAERVPENISSPYIIVDDSRKVLSILSSEFYNNPSSEMNLIGVTGTDGKTSITFFGESAFTSCGEKTGLIGTIFYRFDNIEKKSSLTTPSSLEIQKIFAEMRERKIEYAFMEVSSHAISQKRIEGIDFSYGIFTNIGREHLDYHKTFEEYANVKRSFFFDYLPKSPKFKGSIFNVDDKMGRKMADEFLLKKLTVSLKKENADIYPLYYNCTLDGIEAEVKLPDGVYYINTPFIGGHNLTNIMSVLGVISMEGLSIEEGIKGIKNLKKIPGRLERVKNNLGIHLFVDYCHNPNSLESVLKNISLIHKGRIITVMGCGGDRDRLKRPLMGKIGYLLSNVLIITSDNPRSEDPVQIINEIMVGVEEEVKKYNKRLVVIEKNREIAIRKAIEISEKGDLILIAGKGHENYQIIGDKVIDFSDVEVAKKWIKEKEARAL